MSANIFEDTISALGQRCFFKEFTFAKNVFSPKKGENYELADVYFWLDTHGIIIQAKERQESETSENLEKWYKNKIEGKAINQIKDTIKFLTDYPDQNVTNNRGYDFEFRVLNSHNFMKIVIYRIPANSEGRFAIPNFYESRRVGFVHILSYDSLNLILECLITPREVIEYLEFRGIFLTKNPEHKNKPEKWLLGRWLISPEIESEDIDEVNTQFEVAVDNLKQDISKFDIREVATRIYERFVGEGTPKKDYYRIVLELSWLSRNEAQMFKERFCYIMTTVCNRDISIPRCFFHPRRQCGFIFISIPHDKDKKMDYLHYMVRAVKQKHKLQKWIGVGIWKEGHGIGISWIYDNEMLIENPYVSDFLEKHPNFCNLKKDIALRYDTSV